MNEDKDVNPAETPSPSVDVIPLASSAEQTPQPEQTQDTPPSAASKSANREALIAKLTANKEQAPETDEPEGAEEETPQKTPEQPGAKKDEPAAPGAPVVQDEPSEIEIGKYSPNAQSRIRQALKRAKEAEARVQTSDGLATFGADILDRAQKAGVPPQVFVDWVDTGAEIYANPTAGVEKLIAMATHLGWKAPSAVAPEGLETLLKKLEEDLEISPDAAATLRARLKPKETPPPPRQAPPVVPQHNTDQLMMDRTVLEMNKIGGDYAKVHGAAWGEIEKAAAKELEKHKGAPPGMWPGLFRDAVELAVAKRKASAPPLKTPTKTLRPTTAPPGKEAPKSNREKVLQKYSER